ncbi:helix-turn-helix domain-containing protein [Streptomyces cupreus]|uniref:Helix-turn-helix transcriptional regulator n=1 Tax=Streptomyces cupreus TaxID=2759956 RepID=A0A7X1J6F5_9ACTN|nr:helix-turn-helix transcriptional regulator [Streptomyces cupreus]MBC2903992.1 helix-turn-helix transcriptional regulator [Streptomyces cupreus]
MDNDDSTPGEPIDLRELSPQEAPTVNQLVAYNMTRARRARGWTQQQVADRLEKYTGRSWSKASISAAERSWQGGRPRKFDADELLALSVIFDTPIAYFLLPMEEGNRAIAMAQPEDRGGGGAYIAGVPLLLSRVLMDRMATEGGSEFFVRAHAAALKYLKVDWHAPVFLEPDMLPPGTVFPPGYRFGDPLDEPDDAAVEDMQREEETKKAKEAASRLTREQLHAIVRLTAESTVQVLIEQLGDAGEGQEGDASEWGKQPPGKSAWDEEPPF